MGAARRSAALRATGRGGVILGVVNGAIPFTLIAWGEKHVDSGIAAIANASVPIFVALLAIRFNPSERVTGMRLAGVLLGLVGVGSPCRLASGGRVVGRGRDARGRRRLALVRLSRTSSRSTGSRRRRRS